MDETLQLRVYHENARPSLVYLPGLHGDWTLIAGFRAALAGRVRFVEMTYPRTLDWSLDGYAAAIEEALQERGINSGWLLGESFGSQLVWPLLRRGRFAVEGIILAGGFVNHPMGWGVRLAEKVTGRISLRLLTRILFGYARVARWRFRSSPAVVQGVSEFLARRTELDRQAAVHRLRLIGAADWREVAQSAGVPIFAMTGVLDPVVPWLAVRRWLRARCPALREYKVIWGADHNVLGTASRRAAEQALKWMRMGA